MVEFRILGPLEVVADGRALGALPAKPRALLAMLLLHANRTVAVDALVEGLWGASPPRSAAKLLQGYVSRLRAELPGSPGELLLTRARGYEVKLEADQLDLLRCERLLADGRSAAREGRLAAAAAALRAALGLWRGPPLADLRDAPFAQAAVAQLDELRIGAHETCLDAELQLGRHAELVAELRDLAAAHPYRERLTGQLMLALYRSGRQAEALETYRAARRRLVEELGLEPSQELRGLEAAILAHAAALDSAGPESPPEAPVPALPAAVSGASRRLVTVLRVALADPVALAAHFDPEALHGVLNRCWDGCAAVIERHGGAVEQLGADALSGSFGLAALHEDDALRAVRAALELRDAVDVDLRAGVDTGVVFVGAAARGGRFATGEPVNGAVQLAAAANAGEVLVGRRTCALVEGAVRTAPAAVGRRVLGLAPETPQRPAAPFVGRAVELAALRALFAAAAEARACRLVTILGPPGIGKSRLAGELLDGLRERATVLAGRCVAYGRGVTFRALADIVRQLEPARLLDEPAARRVFGAVGESEQPGRLEETFWAFRRLFEALARERPLVVALEDVHWAEPALLDLVDSVAALSDGAPILLLCLARPELLESRPAWAAPQSGRALVVLDALGTADARALAEHLGAGGSAARIAATAEGNPLFLEQLVAVRAEGGDERALPLSIQAVLATRIDRLEPGERAVLERASVEGRTFHRGLVAELVPELERDELDRRLLALVRRQLIGAARPELPGEEAFRFAHALICEAAYAGLSKQLRAALHERVGRRLAGVPGAGDELVGYHLEQAFHYAAELVPPGDAARGLAAEAARRLARAARAALVRGDLAAGASLLARGVALLDQGDPARGALLCAHGVALFEAGRLDEAHRVLAGAAAEAAATHDDGLAARVSVERELLRLHAEPGAAVATARRAATAAARVLAARGDELGQCRAWRLLAWIEWIESQAARADGHWRRAAEHARRAGDDRELFEILGWRASAACFGPMPAEEAIRRCEAIRARVRGSPVAAAVVLRPLALLHALRGDFDAARRLLAEGNALLDELGRLQSAVSHHEAIVELLAGEPAAAERRLRLGYERLAAMGEKSLLATTAAYLAQAVHAQDRGDEADALCATSERWAPPDDLVTHALWRGVRALIRAGQGRLDDAEALARAAVADAGCTDALVERGDALLALAEILERRGRGQEAAGAARQALALYERKGAVILAARARERLHTTSGRS